MLAAVLLLLASSPPDLHEQHLLGVGATGYAYMELRYAPNGTARVQLFSYDVDQSRSLVFSEVPGPLQEEVLAARLADTEGLWRYGVDYRLPWLDALVERFGYAPLPAESVATSANRVEVTVPDGATRLTLDFAPPESDHYGLAVVHEGAGSERFFAARLPRGEWRRVTGCQWSLDRTSLFVEIEYRSRTAVAHGRGGLIVRRTVKVVPYATGVAGYYNLRAYGHLKRLELDAAQNDWLTVVGLDPYKGDALYNLACTYALQGDARTALRYLREAIEQNPAHYREAAQRDPDFKELRSNADFQGLVYPKRIRAL